MSKRPWMPLYIADYLADTQHLSAEESGAYLFLIMAYWQNGGPLPDDDASLRRITRISPQRWPQKREVMMQFFSISSGHLRHARIDAELSKSDQRSVKAQASAKLRWDASVKDADAYATRAGNADAYALGMLPQPQPQESVPMPESEALTREANGHGRQAGRADDLAFELAGMAGMALNIRNAAASVTIVQRWLDDGISAERCRSVVAHCLASGQQGQTRSLKRFDAIIRSDHAVRGGAVYTEPPKPPPVEEQIAFFEKQAGRMHAIGNVDAEVEWLSKAEALKLKVQA